MVNRPDANERPLNEVLVPTNHVRKPVIIGATVLPWNRILSSRTNGLHKDLGINLLYSPLPNLSAALLKSPNRHDTRPPSFHWIILMVYVDKDVATAC
jgi:hypothetical protein